jgi:hypothetical protein
MHMEHLQRCSLQKYFSIPSLVIYFFSNPTHKPKTGTANRWETTNSNPLGPLKLSSQSTADVRVCCAFYQPQQTVQKCWGQNHFAEPNGHVWIFLHSILICRVTCSAPVELLYSHIFGNILLKIQPKTQKRRNCSIHSQRKLQQHTLPVSLE